MTKLKKSLPVFANEIEEAEYWDTHSVLEHFDENDFEPLQVKTVKDTPITIRLDSESRRILEKMSGEYKIGTSTLARMFITTALSQWQRKQKEVKPSGELALNLERSIPDRLKQKMEMLFQESATGSFYILSQSQLETLSKTLVRDALKGAGYKAEQERNLPEGAKRED